MKQHETVFIVAVDKVDETEKLLSTAFGQRIEITAFGLDGKAEVGLVSLSAPASVLSENIEAWRAAGIEVIFPSVPVHKALAARGIVKGNKKTETTESKKLKAEGK